MKVGNSSNYWLVNRSLLPGHVINGSGLMIKWLNNITERQMSDIDNERWHTVDKVSVWGNSFPDLLFYLGTIVWIFQTQPWKRYIIFSKYLIINPLVGPTIFYQKNLRDSKVFKNSEIYSPSLKASVTILADFGPEFNPPFRWRSKHQTKITVRIINLVYSEFPNRSCWSVRSFISTLNCTWETRGHFYKNN